MSSAPASWGPSRLRTLAYAGASAAALLFALASSDGPLALEGGLAFLVLTVVGAVLAGLDLWFGTVLSADPDGIVLSAGGGRRRRVPWAHVVAVRAGTTNSRGLLKLSSLELDLARDGSSGVSLDEADEVGETDDAELVVLSGHRLGAVPALVAARLQELRASAR